MIPEGTKFRPKTCTVFQTVPLEIANAAGIPLQGTATKKVDENYFWIEIMAFVTFKGLVLYRENTV